MKSKHEFSKTQEDLFATNCWVLTDYIQDLSKHSFLKLLQTKYILNYATYTTNYLTLKQCSHKGTIRPKCVNYTWFSWHPCWYEYKGTAFHTIGQLLLPQMRADFTDCFYVAQIFSNTYQKQGDFSMTY